MSSPPSLSGSSVSRRPVVDPAMLESLRQKAIEQAALMRDSQNSPETTTTNTTAQPQPQKQQPAEVSPAYHPLVVLAVTPQPHFSAYAGHYSAPTHPRAAPYPHMYPHHMAMQPYPYAQHSTYSTYPVYPYSPYRTMPPSHLHPLQLPPQQPHHAPPIQHPYGIMQSGDQDFHPAKCQTTTVPTPRIATPVAYKQETEKSPPPVTVKVKVEKINRSRLLNFNNLRTFPSIRAIVASDHAEDIEAGLSLVRASAWIFQPEKVKKYTEEMFQNSSSASSSAKPKFGHPLLTNVHHIRPLQWYGHRMRSLSRGWVTPNARSEFESITEAEFDALDKSELDSSKLWTVVTFAILDANSRAFPFLMEWCEGDTNGGTCPRAFIYTCKRDLDDPFQLGPDVCIGRIVSVSDSESQVVIDLPRLRSALPLFAAAFQPHSVDCAARAHCVLNDAPFRTYRTSLEMKNYHVKLFSELPKKLDFHQMIEEWTKEPLLFDNAAELLSQPRAMGKSFRFAHGDNIAVEACEEFAIWRKKLRKFYASMSADEFLQSQLEVMCAAMALQLLPRGDNAGMPIRQFTENQHRELRHQLTLETLKGLTPSQAKAFTSAALPPPSANMTSALTDNAIEPPYKKQRTEYRAGAKWPHAKAVWGPVDTRPLPNDLIRLIAEYALDDLELVDLLWIEEEESLAGGAIERKIVYGVHPEADDFGDYDDDDK